MNECAVYTIEEVAQMLGVGRSTAYDAARRGELPVVRLGRRLLVPRARLNEFLGINKANGSGTGAIPRKRTGAKLGRRSRRVAPASNSPLGRTSPAGALDQLGVEPGRFDDEAPRARQGFGSVTSTEGRDTRSGPYGSGDASGLVHRSAA